MRSPAATPIISDCFDVLTLYDSCYTILSAVTRDTANFTRGMKPMKQLLTLALDSDVLETLTDENIAELEAVEDYE